MARRLSNKAKLKSLFAVTSGAVALFGGISLYQGNEKFYNEVAIPLVQRIDSETAHGFAIKILKWGLVPKQETEDPSSLRTTAWGLQFKNPLGMAAGFDKQGEAVEGLHKIGFSFVEIGKICVRIINNVCTSRYNKFHSL
jgi:dihydroorotate dehydrogenase